MGFKFSWLLALGLIFRLYSGTACTVAHQLIHAVHGHVSEVRQGDPMAIIFFAIGFQAAIKMINEAADGTGLGVRRRPQHSRLRGTTPGPHR